MSRQNGMAADRSHQLRLVRVWRWRARLKRRRLEVGSAGRRIAEGWRVIAMLKTVRLGATSLQYAIVSQTDESAVAAGGGRALAAPPHRAKTKRRSRYRKTVMLILVTLVVGCCVVIAAVLVPIVVASRLVGTLPESAKFQTFAVAASSVHGLGKYDRNGRRYVELLPIEEPPVDAVIQFGDSSPSAPRRPPDSAAAIAAWRPNIDADDAGYGSGSGSDSGSRRGISSSSPTATLAHVDNATNKKTAVAADSSASSEWNSTSSRLLLHAATLAVSRIRFALLPTRRVVLIEDLPKKGL